MADGCRLVGWAAPRDLKVILVAIPPQGGSPEPYEELQVEVALPAQQPVALLLMYPEPAIWRLQLAPGSVVSAVYLAGGGAQRLEGATVPVFNTTDPALSRCGYGYIAPENEDFIQPIARHHFGRTVDQVVFLSGGRARIDRISAIGQAPEQFAAPGLQPEVLPDAVATEAPADAAGPGSDASTPPGVPPASPEAAFPDTGPQRLPEGREGLAEAMRRGYLRPARPDEIDAFMQAMLRATPPGSRQPNRPDHMFPAYLVLQPFQLPPGLTGANAASFIVPRDVARPTGDPGHSTIYDWNGMSCTGVLCWMGQ